MLSSADRLHTFLLYILDAGALLANLMLIALIALRTPREMRCYSILLLNNAMIDAMSAVASALSVGRLINRPDGSQVCVFLGPCAMRGPWFCQLSFAVHMFLSCHSTVITLHSFCFRLYILRRTNTELPVVSTTRLISLALYLPTCAAIAVFCSVFEITPSALVKELHLEPYTTTFYAGKDARFIIPVGYVIVSSPMVPALNFAIRRELLKQIRMMDAAKRIEHARIARALTYQLLLPVGMVLGSAAWLADAAGVWSSELSQRLPMIRASPLFNLIFLPPYRSFFQRPRLHPSATEI